MEGIKHTTVSVNGLNMHIAELGQGPMVLFLHGFPELWYTWRHQMVYMAAHGYRAVAPDLRGFGDTTGAPTGDPTKFTMLHVVGDIVALIGAVAAPEEDKVFVVGHDWGSLVAWNLAMYRPDKIRALLNMSVVFTPRNPKMKPLDALRALYGDDYYVCRIQVLSPPIFSVFLPIFCLNNTLLVAWLGNYDEKFAYALFYTLKKKKREKKQKMTFFFVMVTIGISINIMMINLLTLFELKKFKTSDITLFETKEKIKCDCFLEQRSNQLFVIYMFGKSTW